MTLKGKRVILTRILWGLFTLTAVAGLVTLFVQLWRRWVQRKPVEAPPPAPLRVTEGVQGLTEAEAESRQEEGLDNVVFFDPPRNLNDIIRDNVLTIFNLSLLGVAVVQFMLGLTLDGLISLGVSLLNIGLQVGQELFVRKRLEGVVQAARPHAIVIRDGQARSVDPHEIVRGDALLVSPGDQFMADGVVLSESPILVNEARVTGEGTRLTKRTGDPVYAGSYCVSGRAAYRAEKVGEDRLVNRLVANAPPQEKVLTPLERIVERVLRVMLIVVVVLMTVLIVRLLRIDTLVGLDSDTIVSTTSVIFSLAPAGLYFMVFLNYLSGTMQLAREGALVHRFRSVETLAHAKEVFITQGSTRYDAVVRMEPSQTSEGNGRVADSRLRQILGDFGRSTATRNQAVLALADSFPGEKRTPIADIPFLSAYGWIATSFDEQDLKGVYVLGEPAVLTPFLAEPDGLEEKPETEQEDGEDRSLTQSVRRGISGLGRFFRSSDEAEEVEIKEKSESEDTQSLPAGDPAEDAIEPGEGSGRSFRSLFGRIGKAIRRESEDSTLDDDPSATDAEKDSDEEFSEELVYLFAYQPNVIPLHNAAGEPEIPQGLQPLCHLYFSNEVRPETIETLQRFAGTGVYLKVLSPASPDRVVKALQKAGIGAESEALTRVIHGNELAAMDEQALREAGAENSIFGFVSPDQSSKLVKSIRQDGTRVAVVGGGPSDLPVMQQANLSIAPYGSSQAAISVADIILLKESPRVLMRLLEEGQKIVNALLDVLKLFITQLVYLVLLIFIIALPRLGFPYLASQGSFIAIATLTVPSLALSFWALSGTPPRVNNLWPILMWFVGPAALAISLAGTVVYLFFMNNTGEEAYAQLALTHMLVHSGLALVVLVRPPTRRIRRQFMGQEKGEGQEEMTRDWRPTILFLVLGAVFSLIAPMRWMDTFFDIGGLRVSQDYLIVWAGVFAWILIVEVVWHTVTPKPYRHG